MSIALMAATKGIAATVGKQIMVHSPSILAVFGTGFVIFGGYETAKATPKFEELLEQEKQKIRDQEALKRKAEELEKERDKALKELDEYVDGTFIDDDEDEDEEIIVEEEEVKEATEEETEEEQEVKLPISTTVVCAAKAYWKPALFIAGGLGCFWAGLAISLKRLSAVTAALALTTKNAEEFREKTKQLVGEEKVKEIDREIAADHAQEKAQEARGSQPSTFETTGYGDSPFYDKPMHRWYRSCRANVQQSFNFVNQQMIEQQYSCPFDDVVQANWNDLADKLGLEECDAGECLGWDYKRHGLIKPRFESIMAPWGEAVTCVDYEVYPLIGDTKSNPSTWY